MKKFLLIIFILAFLAGITIIYLNNVYLPTKIKALVINTLQEKTQKKVTFETLKFNIFKGLVLRNITIYDGAKPLVTLKEASCMFFILPIFQKRIVIPAINLKSPVVFLERYKDNTFNLGLPKEKLSTAPPPKAGFKIFIYRVNLQDGIIHFQDNALSQPFAKDIEHLNLVLHLSLPASVKFKLKSVIASMPDININASGEYNIPGRQFSAKVSISDFSPQDFSPYYRNLGINITDGLIRCLANLKLKDGIINVELKVQNKNLAISKEKLSGFLNSDIDANLEYSLNDKQLQYSGKATLSNSRLTWPGYKDPINNINGDLIFNNSGLTLDKLSAVVLGLPIQAKINLTNFQGPLLKADVFSKDLSLRAVLAINKQLIKLSKLSGQYFNSKFSITGDIDTSSAPDLGANIQGRLKLNLADLKALLKDYQKPLELLKPAGFIEAKFNLNGNLNNIKSCAINIESASPSISILGLKSGKLQLDYNQAGGIASIRPMHLSCYGGSIDINAGMNLTSENQPFWLSADIEGVKIEELKQDTAAKDKDISGIIKAEAKLNGSSGDISKLTGAGQASISEGKLWQLNLFKGLGSLLFARDFANIIFSEGYCAFSVQDKSIFSDNLVLKSNIANLSGPVKIDFDGAIDASFNVQVLDELVPLSGTFKDITTAIVGQAGRFGVIKITGTLKEPKYKFKTAVADLFKGLKDAILKNLE